HATVTDAPSYEAALGQLLSALCGRGSNRRLVIVIESAGRGREKEVYDVLSVLHTTIAAAAVNNRYDLQLICADEYGLWYHERLRLEPRSNWPWIDRFVISLLSETDIKRGLQSAARQHLSETDAQDIARRAFMRSGGHLGLVLELVTDLVERRWRVGHDYWENEVASLWANGHVLEGLRRDTLEDPVGLATTAMEL